MELAQLTIGFNMHRHLYIFVIERQREPQTSARFGPLCPKFRQEGGWEPRGLHHKAAARGTGGIGPVRVITGMKPNSRIREAAAPCAYQSCVVTGMGPKCARAVTWYARATLRVSRP